MRLYQKLILTILITTALFIIGYRNSKRADKLKSKIEKKWK